MVYFSWQLTIRVMKVLVAMPVEACNNIVKYLSLFYLSKEVFGLWWQEWRKDKFPFQNLQNVSDRHIRCMSGAKMPVG